MDIGSLLLALALMGVVLAFVARPLIERAGEQVSDQEQEISSLLADRERVLDALQELDMDRTMGKVLEGDYQEQRLLLVREGAQILRRLDQLEGDRLQAPQEGNDLAVMDKEIEAEVLQLRREIGERGDRLYCPACGQQALAGDRFCTNCGQPLAEGESP